VKPGATLIRGILNLVPPVGNPSSVFTLIDACGRRTMFLHPGPNDVSRLAPGVYFIKEQGPGIGDQKTASRVPNSEPRVRKVVIRR